MKYPKECPVFEYIGKHWFSVAGRFVSSPVFEMVEVDGDRLFRLVQEGDEETAGFLRPWRVPHWEMQPLTPAARAMIAIARAGAK